MNLCKVDTTLAVLQTAEVWFLFKLLRFYLLITMAQKCLWCSNEPEMGAIMEGYYHLLCI